MCYMSTSRILSTYTLNQIESLAKKSVTATKVANPVTQPEDETFKLYSPDTTIPQSTNALQALKDFMKYYPFGERWRLLVDGILYANPPITKKDKNYDSSGWSKYEEREPGAITAFLSAWQFCQNAIRVHPEQTDLTIDFIKELHKRVTFNVTGKIGVKPAEGGIFHGWYVTFYLSRHSTHRYTKNGLQDFLLAIKDNLPHAQLLVRRKKLVSPNVFSEDEKNKRLEDFIMFSKMNDQLYWDTVRGSHDARNLDTIKSIFPNVQSDIQKVITDKNPQVYFALTGKTLWHTYQLNSETIVKHLSNMNTLTDKIWLEIKKNGALYIAPKVSRNNLEILVTDAIVNFNANIKTATTDDNKLEVIGNLIQNLERIHPFPDANGRTFVNLLLNYLLIKNGFPPATFLEPNLFDAFGHTVEVLKRGIANTVEIYHGKKDLFGFKITDNSQKIQMDNFIFRSFRMNEHLQNMQNMQNKKHSINNIASPDNSNMSISDSQDISIKNKP